MPEHSDNDLIMLVRVAAEKALPFEVEAPNSPPWTRCEPPTKAGVSATSQRTRSSRNCGRLKTLPRLLTLNRT